AGKPLPHHGSSMIGSVVVDKEHLLAPISLRHTGQKCRVTLSFKDLSMRKIESRSIEIDRPEDLLGIALASRGNQRLVSAARPGLIETGILTKTGFIAEEQRSLSFHGFFLTLDRCIVAIGLAPLGRLWLIYGVVFAPKNPKPSVLFAHDRDDSRRQIPP